MFGRVSCLGHFLLRSQLAAFCFLINTSLHFQHWHQAWWTIAAKTCTFICQQHFFFFYSLVCLHKHKTVMEGTPLSTTQFSPANPTFYSIYRLTGLLWSDQDGCSHSPSIIISTFPPGFWHRGCIICLHSPLLHSARTFLSPNCVPILRTTRPRNSTLHTLMLTKYNVWGICHTYAGTYILLSPSYSLPGLLRLH